MEVMMQLLIKHTTSYRSIILRVTIMMIIIIDQLDS